MVLCASTDDHTKVELVEPPTGAVPGERVTFAGFPGDAEKALKKETLEKVLPVCIKQSTNGLPLMVMLQDLKSNGDLVATYKGVPFMTSAGLCVVKSIANGVIR
jgi:methionyl-tRNA synthetase